MKTIVVTSEELEIARRAVEDVLIDYRDSRISQPMRGNGLVCREKDGSDSSLIRLGLEEALAIGIKAINQHRSKSQSEDRSFSQERSLMFYLLDTLDSAPARAKEILREVRGEFKISPFKEAWKRLWKSSSSVNEITLTSTKIREEII